MKITITSWMNVLHYKLHTYIECITSYNVVSIIKNVFDNRHFCLTSRTPTRLTIPCKYLLPIESTKD